MCQLTFIAPSNWKHAKELAVRLLTLNSEKNKDGWGIVCNDVLYKTKEMAAADVINVTDKILTWDNRVSPLIGHVRLASINKGEITDEFAHPFDTPNLVLAHNGTLKLKKGDFPAGVTDSMHFANMLSALYETKPEKTIPELVESLYKSAFNGKFAFMIYDKIRNKYYVIRGRTASLFIGKIYMNDKVVMTVVNTEKDTLAIAIEEVRVSLLLQGKDLSYDIAEVEKDTMFEFNMLNHSLVKCGSITETWVTYTTPANTRTFWQDRTDKTNENIMQGSLEKFTINEIKSFFKHHSAGEKAAQLYDIICIFTVFGLDLESIDLIVRKIYNFPLYSLPDDINISILSDLVDTNTDKRRRHWIKLVNIMGKHKLATTQLDIYRVTGLSFPYWFNSEVALQNAITGIEKRVK